MNIIKTLNEYGYNTKLEKYQATKPFCNLDKIENQTGIPLDIWEKIIKLLDLKDYLAILGTCHFFRQFAYNSIIHSVIQNDFLQNYNSKLRKILNYPNHFMFGHALHLVRHNKCFMVKYYEQDIRIVDNLYGGEFLHNWIVMLNRRDNSILEIDDIVHFGKFCFWTFVKGSYLYFWAEIPHDYKVKKICNTMYNSFEYICEIIEMVNNG